jgi:GNAT superfamily N-acetyltransferase
MNLVFEKVLANESDKIRVVYEIIKLCGEDMFHRLGLFHWKNPYPIEDIMKNCIEADVYLIKDKQINQYVHTFHLKFIIANIDEHTAIISKFATLPQFAGKGIGKLSLEFIENICKNKGVKKLSLDVYEKSEHAINFYKNNDFEIVGTKHTKHFKVYIMEKQLA